MDREKHVALLEIPAINVVAGIIFNEKNEVLIGQRADGHGFWEFPGGKVEIGETQQDALKRELKEELNIHFSKIQECFDHYEYGYAHKIVQLYFFKCIWSDSDTLQKNVHLNVQWIPLKKLSEFQFLSGNKRVIEQLLSKA